MEKIYSTGQMARLLGVQAHRIEYAHSSGRPDEPQLRFLGKRVYTAGDVDKVAEYFGVKLEEQSKPTNCESETK